MGLIDNINKLDRFFNSNELRIKFNEQYYEFNGMEIPPLDQRVNYDEYTVSFGINAGGDKQESKEIHKLEHYKLSSFKQDLNCLKEVFEYEYLSYEALTDKLAFGNSFRNYLLDKLKKFSKNPETSIYVDEFKKFIDKLSREYISHQDKADKTNSSFKYRDGASGYDSIRNLYKTLLANNLIGSETKFEDFDKVFQNKKIDNKIRWIGETSQLKYFIELINRPDLNFYDNKSSKWKIGVKCFVQISNKTLKPISSRDLNIYKITSNTRTLLDTLVVRDIFKK
ncbi:hypothetical protein [Mariniflexile sp.]|uniref:hypothetical protein n=1 Tax=Mariniflexile sp. TaxID=1979402 RepID=UPI003563CA88